MTAALQSAKWTFTTRRVNRAAAVGLGPDVARARVGDLVLARVETIGAHKRVQLDAGRPSALWRGDLIVAACGARYAADQFEGAARIAPEGCDLLAGGGVLGRLEGRNAAVAAPTRCTPLGLLTGADGAVLNLADYARPRAAAERPRTVIALLGAGMNAGKTTAAAALIRGLTSAGRRVAGIKATGTGAFGDVNAYADAGAALALDFTDDGLPSTYRVAIDRIEAGIDALLAHAAADGCDAAVVELADGVLQPETAALLADGRAARFDATLYAAGDALSAAGGLAALARLGVAPLAVTGLLTRAPLAVREAEAATGAWVLGRDALADPSVAGALAAMAAPAPARAAA